MSTMIQFHFGQTTLGIEVQNEDIRAPSNDGCKRVRISIRIAEALNSAKPKTVGELRETPDKDVLRFQDLGPGSVAAVVNRRAHDEPFV